MKNKQNCAAKILTLNHTNGVTVTDLRYYSKEISWSSQIQDREFKFKKKEEH